MAAEQLVGLEIEQGLQLVRVLDEAKFPVSAALWLFSSDLERWRFVIATTNLPQQIAQRQLEAATIVAKWKEDHDGDQILDLARVRFVSDTDQLISGLGKVMKLEGLSEVRFSNNMINGVFVEDAIVHRLAA